MIDILLVSLPIQTLLTKQILEGYDFSPSMGLIYLNTYLELNGFRADIIDLIYDNLTKEQFLNKVDELSPLVIGISSYTENIELAVKVAKSIKNRFPNIYTVIGGPHISLCQKEFIDNKEFDFAIINEGESTIVELLEAIKTNQQIIRYNDIDGLMYRIDNEIFHNPNRQYIKALDLIPIPKRDYFGLERFKNNKLLLINSSRGCPNKCIYCSANVLSGNKYRVRNIDNVFLEIIMLQKLIDPIQYTITDDSFTIIRSRVNRFLDLIDEYKATFRWECESIVKHMDEELLDRLKDSNVISIQYGMESGNQEVLNKIRKGINLEYAEKIIKATQERGITPLLSFIFGHFCETKETAQDTLDFMRKAVTQYDASVAASYNTPFPGTYQYEHMDELNMYLLTDDFKMFTLKTPVVYNDNFSADDQRNFMYEVANLRKERKCYKYNQ